MDFQIETEEKDEEVKAKEVEPRYIPKENPKNSWRLGSWSTIEPKNRSQDSATIQASTMGMVYMYKKAHRWKQSKYFLFISRFISITMIKI